MVLGQGSVTGKRAAEDAAEGENERKHGGAGMVGVCEETEDGDMFPGPKIGGGPQWRLPGKSGNIVGGASLRCKQMLDQALSCSALADVRFLFDDGCSLLSGHRAMLSGMSSEFLSMFESGMIEAKTGEVRVRGVSRESFRGFLELLYLGKAGVEIGRADGREVWVLADMYNVKGIKEWMIRDGLEDGSVCAAMQFALEGEGFFDELVTACRKRAARSLDEISEKSLQGVSFEAAQRMLEGFVGKNREVGCAQYRKRERERLKRLNGKEKGEEKGEYLEAFEYIMRWAKANGGLVCGNEGVDSLVEALDISNMQYKDLVETVKASGLVKEEQLDELLRQRVAEGKLEGRRIEVLKTFGASAGADKCFGGPAGADDWHFEHPHFSAVSRKDGGRRLAVSDLDRKKVAVFDIQSGECKICWDVNKPLGVAFNDEDELIVCDSDINRILVYDEQGKVVREFGGYGQENGKLYRPAGVAVNLNGEIIVCDSLNHRVQIFLKDGTFVRSFGKEGNGAGHFQEPGSVAVGPFGEIVVVDKGSPGAPRIQIFDPEGSYQMTIRPEKKHKVVGPFEHVAVSAHGEILVTAFAPSTARKQRPWMTRCDEPILVMYQNNGAFIRSFGVRDLSSVDLDWLDPAGLCVDANGHVFISNLDNCKVIMLA